MWYTKEKGRDLVSRLSFEATTMDNDREVLSVLRHEFSLSTGAIRRAKKQSGCILLNDQPVTVRDKIKSGDRLVFELSDRSSSENIPAEKGILSLWYEDENLLILEKPAGLAVHPTSGQYEGTLAGRLAYYFEQKGEPFVFRAVNRLDRGTSGLMAVAKNSPTCTFLQKQLESGKFIRRYLALCEGLLPSSGTICAPIGRADNSVIRREVRADGALAVTHFTSEKQVIYQGHPLSLVRLELETGRTHQIRVHMAHIGHPLVCDFLYGTERPSWLNRAALHSAELHVTLQNGTSLDFYSPLPPDMERLLSCAIEE